MGRHNFVSHALAALAPAGRSRAAGDRCVSPTYVPDLVNVCLDLLIDGERGLWHLDQRRRRQLGRARGRACDARRRRDGDAAAVHERRARRSRGAAAQRVLSSERAILMPSLDDALARFITALAERANDVGEAAHYAC